MKRVLITGAAGSLGDALRKQLSKNNENKMQYEVIAAGSHEDPEKNLTGLDITKQSEVDTFITKWQPDIIVNCAAYTAVDLCEDEQEACYAVNVLGPEYIAKAAQKIGAVFFHISTDYVFAGDGNHPYKETDETDPKSVYGRTKREGELAVEKYCEKYFILRTAWLYGAKKSFVSTMLRLAASGNPVRVVDDQIGAPTSADELAKAIIALFSSNHYGILHTTCEGAVSWYGFAKKIFEYTNTEVTLLPIQTKDFQTKAARPAYSVLDMTKLNEDYGYHCANWEVALQEYLMENDLVKGKRE